MVETNARLVLEQLVRTRSARDHANGKSDPTDDVALDAYVDGERGRGAPEHAPGVPPIRGARPSPTAGFEQAGCGASTPVLCGWEGNSSMSQDTTNPHSGNTSMHVEWAAGQCDYDPDYGWASVGGSTDVTSCIAIQPGTNTASFWYWDAVSEQVSLSVAFFGGRDCTYDEVGSDSVAQPPTSGDAWHGALRLRIGR
jgi:hypothetical protein